VSSAAFVTGGGGFAGGHLVAHLRERGEEPAAPPSSELDLRDAAALRAAVRELRPERVFHLAALASVGRSWEDPSETLQANVDMTVNVLEAVRSEAASAAVLVVSSGEVYGAPERLPVDEDAPLRPRNPYAVSKAACDMLAAVYAAGHGMRVVRSRAFNHAGPGQSDEYVMGTLARQVAEAEAAGRDAAVLRAGNLDSARDFTDVRDVVRGYALAVELEPGAYNVCSGRAVPVRRLVELLGRSTSLPVRVEVEEARRRSVDVPEVRGSAERLRAASGWEPQVPLERTVADALQWWRERVRR
jgi:GDP-4-dehydro-6-deoxy-D-mannose reductase